MTAAPLFVESSDLRSHHIEKMDALTRVAGGITRDIGDVAEHAGTTVLQLLAELPASHPVYERLDDVRESMQRVASVARQLRDFASPAARATPIDLQRVVERNRPLLERLAGPGVAVAYHPSSGPISTSVARGAVEQILLTLVVNARDAMADGGSIHLATTRVHLLSPLEHRHGVLPAGHWAILEVRDEGAGMCPTTVGRLFEPFFTTKEPGRGTGLGLSAVYGVVRQASGQVMVASEPGDGTTVRVALPAAAPEESGHIEPALPADAAILVVDDDEWVRTVTSRLLRRAGYGVIEADGGESAMELMRGVAGRCVRLVLTDVMMPGMNGTGLADTIHRDHPGTRVLLMTGYGAEILPGNRVGASGVPVLAKPFTSDELLAAVRSRLSESASPPLS